MHVFISWSGELSRDIAGKLSVFLEHVVHGIDIFISTQDIDAGERWEEKISKELEIANHAVLCITKTNQYAPWLVYEAGALGKIVGRSKVIPYTIGVSPGELKSGPLSRFQGKENNEDGTWELVISLNRSVDYPKDERFIRENFDVWWPKFKIEMDKVVGKYSDKEGLEDKQLVPTHRELLLELRHDMQRVLRYVRVLETTNTLKVSPENLDSLTGLANRRTLTERMDALRSANIPYCVALVDLDSLKQLNDDHGHQMGDRVISEFSAFLSEKLEAANLIARYGGDEFVVIFVDNDIEKIITLFEDFLVNLPNAMKAAKVPSITASIGLSPIRSDDYETQLRMADQALYQAKQDGKNRLVKYSKLE